MPDFEHISVEDDEYDMLTDDRKAPMLGLAFIIGSAMFVLVGLGALAMCLATPAHTAPIPIRASRQNADGSVTIWFDKRDDHHTTHCQIIRLTPHALGLVSA